MLQKIREFRHWWNRPKSEFEDFIQTAVVFIPLVFLIRTWGYGLYQVPSGSMESTMLVGEFYFADKFSPLYRKPQRGEIISFNDPLYEYSTNSYKRWFEQYVWGPENWTKRVIGLPGEHIQGKIEDGHPVVYINGERLDEPYLNKYPLAYSQGTDGRLHWKSYDPNISFDQQWLYRLDKQEVRNLATMLENSGVVTERVPGTPLDIARFGAYEGSDVYDVQLADDEYWMIGDNRLGSFDSRGWGPLKGNLIHGRIKFRIFSLDRQEKWLILELLLHPIDFFKRCRWSRCLQFVA